MNLLSLPPRLGGSFIESLPGAKVTVEVNNKMEERVSSNVVGVLVGSEEPDRWTQTLYSYKELYSCPQNFTSLPI